jgi:hypothetical protein
MNKINYSGNSTGSQAGIFPLTVQTMEAVNEQIETLTNLARIGGENYTIKNNEGEVVCVVWDGVPYRVETLHPNATHFGLKSEVQSISSDRGEFKNARTLWWVDAITESMVCDYEKTELIENFEDFFPDFVKEGDPRLGNKREPLQHNHSAAEITSGVLPIARGGMGRTTAPAITVDLAGAGNSPSILPASGNVTVNTSGTLPINKGGTGASDAAGARAALGAAAASHGTHILSESLSEQISPGEFWPDFNGNPQQVYQRTFVGQMAAIVSEVPLDLGAERLSIVSATTSSVSNIIRGTIFPAVVSLPPHGPPNYSGINLAIRHGGSPSGMYSVSLLRLDTGALNVNYVLTVKYTKP